MLVCLNQALQDTVLSCALLITVARSVVHTRLCQAFLWRKCRETKSVTFESGGKHTL